MIDHDIKYNISWQNSKKEKKMANNDTSPIESRLFHYYQIDLKLNITQTWKVNKKMWEHVSKKCPICILKIYYKIEACPKSVQEVYTLVQLKYDYFRSIHATSWQLILYNSFKR